MARCALMLYQPGLYGRAQRTSVLDPEPGLDDLHGRRHQRRMLVNLRPGPLAIVRLSVDGLLDWLVASSQPISPVEGTPQTVWGIAQESRQFKPKPLFAKGVLLYSCWPDRHSL